MRRVLKPQSIISLPQSVEIPDYIPPVAPVAEIPEVDLSDIEDENLREKYSAFMDKAKSEAENISAGIISNAEAEQKKIVNEAHQQADKIIDDAKSKSQTFMKNAVRDAEQIRTDAYNEGLEKAVKQKIADVDAVLSEFKSVLEDMKASQLEYFKRYADELKYLALDIVSKVTMNKIDEDDTFLLKLISQNIKAIREADWITVEISEKLPELAKAIENEMSVCSMSKKTEVQLSDELEKSSCILKATDRIVDISLRTQLDNIKSYFEKCDETDD